jgi:hypothetical protein
MRIVSNPEHVCFDHALEFWTGLLVYAREHSDPRVKHERLCSPSAWDHERFPIRLAS